jgi:transposase
MKQKSGPGKAPAEQVLKDIRRQTRRKYSAEERNRIVLEGLRGEENISELCRRGGIAASMYYGWSKEFLEAALWTCSSHCDNNLARLRRRYRRASR